MTTMTIGKLAKAANVPIDTIRYYEKQGLMLTPQRSASGYRLYSSEDLRRIHFIRKAKSLGFTLKDIQDLLSIDDNAATRTCEDVKTIAELKLQEIEEKITELRQIKRALEAVTASCCGGDEPAINCTILNALEH